MRFVSVTPSLTALRPGSYGFEITAVLRNETGAEITDLRATLSFREGSEDRIDHFRWRDADARDGAVTPQPASIPPGEEAMFRFRVDALSHAAGPGPILVNGEATFVAGGTTRSATPLETPRSLPFETLPQPIVVTTAADDLGGIAQLSLREAINQANVNPGFDRIVFDPQVFPAASPAIIQLSNGLGELPAVNGDLVIDGRGAGVVLAVNNSWSASQRYGLRLLAGTLVVSGLSFRDLGENYTIDGANDANNCGSNAQYQGGAILTVGGTLILDGNRFADPNVAERNCYAASVRLEGGSGHRILNNHWTDPSMDAVFIRSSTREVSDNVMDAGASPAKADECIFVSALGAGAELWIVGNLCVDQEFSAVAAVGVNDGKVYVVHNTFARNRALGAVRREGTARRIELRNNAYHANLPASVQATNNGSDFTISHESVSSGTLCNGTCNNATIQQQTITAEDLRLVNPTGVTRADLTPGNGSPLVDSGLDLLDRNGRAPGRFNGKGPERGAVELP